MTPTLVIYLLLKMLRTIQFNHQLGARRAEIHNIRTNGMLAAKANFLYPMSAQPPPQPGLSLR